MARSSRRASPWHDQPAEQLLAQATDTAPEKPRAIRIALVTGPKDHGPGEHDYPAWVAKWKDLLAKQPGVTLRTACADTQNNSFPSRRHRGARLPPFVTRICSPPARLRTYISELPVKFDVNASHFPSGETRGSSSLKSVPRMSCGCAGAGRNSTGGQSIDHAGGEEPGGVPET